MSRLLLQSHGAETPCFLQIDIRVFQQLQRTGHPVSLRQIVQAVRAGESLMDPVQFLQAFVAQGAHRFRVIAQLRQGLAGFGADGAENPCRFVTVDQVSPETGLLPAGFRPNQLKTGLRLLRITGAQECAACAESVQYRTW